MRRTLKTILATLSATLLLTGAFGCETATDSNQPATPPPPVETPSPDDGNEEESTSYIKLFDFEGEQPLRGLEWYTVSTGYHTQMEEVYEEANGNRCMKITAKGSWAGFEYPKDNENTIPIGATTNKIRVRIKADKDIPQLKFSVKTTWTKWVYAVTDIQAGDREYVLEFDESFYQFRGFTLVSKQELYEEIYIDDIYAVVEI